MQNGSTEPESDGKRMISMREYGQALLPQNSWVDHTDVSPAGAVTDENDGNFYLFATREGYFQALPSPEFSPRAYRGQPGFWEPCRPSLWRPLDNTTPERANLDYAKATYWQSKVFEFCAAIEAHPALRDLLAYRPRERKFDYNPYATAQHYGFPTHIMDLSRSYDVAVFFATHWINGCDIVPAVGEEAVLYTVDLSQLMAPNIGDPAIVPMGLDPAPRPQAQQAIGLALDWWQDFNKLAGVSWTRFIVTEELAAHARQRVAPVHRLFGTDIFGAYLEHIRTSNTVCREAINQAFESGLLPYDAPSAEIACSNIARAGYRITEGRISRPPAPVVESAYEDWQCAKRDLVGRIRCRLGADSLRP